MSEASDIDQLLGTEVPLVNLSQSFVKRYWDYKAGKYCGVKLQRVDLLKEFTEEPSEVMKLGNWFEYKCTGMLNRDSSMPERVCTKTGKPTSKTLFVEKQAERFKALVEMEGIDIKATGEVLEHRDHDLGFRLKGVLDVRAVIDGRMAILDIKSSGLIGNEWEEYGWHEGTFNQRDKLTIQVVAYKYLAWKIMDVRDMPFYFSIHSNTNDVVSSYWEVKLRDFDVAMSHFEDTLATVVDGVRNDNEFGFTPYPTVKECEKCPVEKCVYEAKTPPKKVVTIDGIYHNDTDIGTL
jgi:hypothetical protein